MSLVPRCALADTTMTRMQKLSRASGTALVFQCVSARYNVVSIEPCSSQATDVLNCKYDKKCTLLQECHCMLFLTEDNDFRGEDQAITLDEVIESTKGMSGVQQT